MRPLLITLVVGAQAITPAEGQPTTETRVDYVLLIDVSGSMAGLPANAGNANIFPQVKEAVSGFLSELDPGTAVFVGPFSAGLEDFQQFDIGGSADIAAVQGYVSSLNATGNATHVYASLLDAFGRYNAFRSSQGIPRIVVLLVYTDGKDNGPGGRSMAALVEEFGLERQQYDWIYYSTLGVELDPSDRQALEGSGLATYNPNPHGEVTPLRVVEPRYTLLDFGNLLAEPAASREMRFNVRSRSGLPSGFRLQPVARFPALSAHGAAAEVRGEDLDPAAEASTLALRLVNAESLPHGTYSGTIAFEPSAPGVLIVPAEIEARFRYQPRRTVAVSGVEGGRVALGSLDPYGAGEDTVAVEAEVPLVFNSEALAQGGSFVVRVEYDPESPPLPDGVLLINGEAGPYHRVDVGNGRPLVLSANYASGLAPGHYTGTLHLEDGDEVEVDGDVREVRWTFEVAERPWSAAQWAALVLGLLLGIFAIGFVAGGVVTGKWPPWKQDVMRGTLVIRKPPSAQGEIALSGRRSVAVGAGTEHLADAGGRLTVRAERERKADVVRAVAEEGVVLIRRPGERTAVAFGSEVLQDGDVIELPPYVVEYTAY